MESGKYPPHEDSAKPFLHSPFYIFLFPFLALILHYIITIPSLREG